MKIKIKHFQYNSLQLARAFARQGKWSEALDTYLDAKDITTITKDDMLWFLELTND